ncbi:hypothetical protein ACIQLJ_07925 [Microbacterium sp. NPDC091313]
MSSPSHRRPPLPVRERAMCMCRLGAECSSYAAGHALPLIQARLAAATPAGWSDALVERVDERAGEVDLRLVGDGGRVRLWLAAASGVAEGDPVALHRAYGVLAAAGRRRNVAILD